MIKTNHRTKLFIHRTKCGYPEKCILFPYMVEGELVNRKYRGAEKKIFMLESGTELVPWRIDHIGDTPECIIAEGKTPDIPNEVKLWDNSIGWGRSCPSKGSWSCEL